jgi:hypothetical protein
MQEWEYIRICLSDLPLNIDSVDILNDAGKDGWELIVITSNNIAYLKLEITKPASKSPRRKPNPVAPK